MKILIIGKETGFNFIRNYADYLPNHKAAHNAKDAIRAIGQYRPDVVLFEWADSLCAQVTHLPQFHELQAAQSFRTVVRLHDHEVTREDQIARNVAWPRVDAVWFINRLIQDKFTQEITDGIPTFFLPNAVDPAPFTLREKTHKRAGLLSLVFRPRKGIDLAVGLARVCPDWQFHVRVQIPKPGDRFYEYYENVMFRAEGLENVHFEDRDISMVVHDKYPHQDVNDWFADKAVVLSMSWHEGFHYAIPEGMLTGAYPIVWNWPTATDFWDPYTVSSIDEAAQRLGNFRPGRESHNRAYVEANYSPAVLVPKLIHELKKLKRIPA